MKLLSDEIVKKNAEIFLADQKMNDLNHDYHLLKENIEDEQEIYLNLVREVQQLKKELKSDLQIQDKLIQLKNEYNSILSKIVEKKSELESIQNLINIPVANSKAKNVIVADKQKIKKTLKKCSAKTKNGGNCKRNAVENSDYCSIHLKQLKR